VIDAVPTAFGVTVKALLVLADEPETVRPAEVPMEYWNGEAPEQVGSWLKLKVTVTGCPTVAGLGLALIESESPAQTICALAGPAVAVRTVMTKVAVSASAPRMAAACTRRPRRPGGDENGDWSVPLLVV